MAKYKVAYGSKDDIENTIAIGKIPPGTIILTDDSNEMYFYDLDRKLHAYQEKYKFESKEEAETWVNKYNCNGEIISVHEEDVCNLYLVDYSNNLVKVADSQSVETLDLNKITAPDTAEVGQTIVVKKVDADGKPIEWEAVDARSDYDQHDETAKDYIKNRPFYDETTIPIFNQSITLLGSSYKYYHFRPGLSLTKGESYRITINNLVLEFICEGSTVIFKDIGSLGTNLTIKTDTLYLYNSEVTSLDLKIERIVNPLKQLDEKYIPNTIARTEHVHSYNDLKDRPFYEDILFDDTVSLSFYHNMSSPYHYYQLENKLELEVGKKYDIIVDDIALNGLVCNERGNLDSFEAFGDWYGGLSIDSDFMNFWNPATSDKTCHIVIKESNSIKQLDEKFIPNTIQRVSDAVDINSFNKLSEDVIYFEYEGEVTVGADETLLVFYVDGNLKLNSEVLSCVDNDEGDIIISGLSITDDSEGNLTVECEHIALIANNEDVTIASSSEIGTDDGNGNLTIISEKLTINDDGNGNIILVS